MLRNKMKLWKQRLVFNMKVFFLIVTVYCLYCCNNNNNVTFKKNENDSAEKIAIYTSENDRMNAAIDSANKTFPNFLQQLKNPCGDCKNFSIKMRFSFGDNNGEHIWLNNLFLKKDKLFGIVDNEPENGVQVKFGDTVEIDKNALSDWMYIEKDKLIGGYTIKAVYFSSSASEQRQMENDIGAKIE